MVQPTRCVTLHSKTRGRHKINPKTPFRDEDAPIAGLGGVLDGVLALPDARRPARPPRRVVDQLRHRRLRRLRLPALGAGKYGRKPAIQEDNCTGKTDSLLDPDWLEHVAEQNPKLNYVPGARLRHHGQHRRLDSRVRRGRGGQEPMSQ